MNRKADWFSRGRDAFTEGRPGFCDDARISGKDRAEWHRGYAHQQALNSTQASDDERRQTAEAWTQLCNEIFPNP
jgi:hypothetical protein